MDKKYGKNNPNWKGGYRINNDGYAMVLMPDHPRSQVGGYVLEHILIIEKVLGKALPLKAKTHHVNEVRHDNRNENIVVCENDAYHFLLHMRKRALEACGNANWRKCVFCKEYDPPEKMFINSQDTAYHRSCCNKYAVQRRRKKDALAA